MKNDWIRLTCVCLMFWCAHDTLSCHLFIVTTLYLCSDPVLNVNKNLYFSKRVNKSLKRHIYGFRTQSGLFSPFTRETHSKHFLKLFKKFKQSYEKTISIEENTKTTSPIHFLCDDDVSSFFICGFFCCYAQMAANLIRVVPSIMPMFVNDWAMWISLSKRNVWTMKIFFYQFF